MLKTMKWKMVHLGKKIKLEQDIISEKLAKKFPYIDINEHEIQKFLLIFQDLIKLWNSDEGFSDSEDGITETLLTIGKQIHNLLNKGIKSLKFPSIIKKVLKTLKTLLNLITTFKKVLKKRRLTKQIN